MAVWLILKAFPARIRCPRPETPRCGSHPKEMIVNRANFCLILFSAGLCLALLCPGLASHARPAWDPAEERSGALNKKAVQIAGRTIHPATSQTLSRWKGPRIARAVVRSSAARSTPGGARTNLVSLTSTSSVLDACSGDPDIEAQVISVTPAGMNGANYRACSTTIKAPYSANSNCSVGTNPGLKDQFCSTSAVPGAMATYCSTNAGGAPGYPGPGSCSVTTTNQANSACSAGAAGNLLHAGRPDWDQFKDYLLDLRVKRDGVRKMQRWHSSRQLG